MLYVLFRSFVFSLSLLIILSIIWSANTLVFISYDSHNFYFADIINILNSLYGVFVCVLFVWLSRHRFAVIFMIYMKISGRTDNWLLDSHFLTVIILKTETEVNSINFVGKKLRIRLFDTMKLLKFAENYMTISHNLRSVERVIFNQFSGFSSNCHISQISY